MGEKVVVEEVVLTKANSARNVNSIMVMTLHDDDSVLIKKGRIGSNLASIWKQGWDKEKLDSEVQRLINQKYTPIKKDDKEEVQDVDGGSRFDINLHDKVKWLLNLIMEESSADMNKWLNAEIGDLSQTAIGDARDILQTVSSIMNERKLTTPEMIGISDMYYGIIPTVLSTQSSAIATATNLFNSMDIEFERLNQLEAAISVDGNNDYLSALNNPQISYINHGSSEFEKIRDMITSTSEGYKVAEVFSVGVPSCISRYGQEDKGKNNIQLMYHGTYLEYVQHIIRTGLRRPQTSAEVKSGSRFGMGIYFADKAERSLNYSGHSDYMPLFLCDVKLGNMRVMDGMDSGLESAGEGYDSVHGVSSYGGMDEWIIYKNGQQTIRYLAMVKR